LPKKKKRYRKFVIIEGLYINYGDIAPLQEIVKLKEEFHFHLIMDDSFGIGVLGPNGRGTCEHWGVDTSQIDILAGSLGHSIGSLGGFTCGNKTVIFHQRLNSSGYVFSASSPPYLVSSAIKAISLIQENPDLIRALHAKVDILQRELAGIEHFGLRFRAAAAPVPVIHLRLTKPSGDRFEDERRLQAVVDEARKRGLLLSRAQYVDVEKFIPPPSIRLTVTVMHDDQEIVEAAAVIKKCAEVAIVDK